MKRAKCLAYTMSVALGAFVLATPSFAEGSATKKAGASQRVMKVTKKKVVCKTAPVKKKVVTKPAQAAAPKPTKPIDPDSAKVLDPNLFAGQVKLGYELTRQQPSVAKQLFCYCGCDVTDLHATLLDCYTDLNRHAADCKHCIDEMLIAVKMLKEGKTMADVQKFLHETIGIKEYPFNEPTVAYENYLKRTGLKFVRSPLAEPVPPRASEGSQDALTASGCCHSNVNRGVDGP